MGSFRNKIKRQCPITLQQLPIGHQYFQEKMKKRIKAFQPKAQVFRSKIQSCQKPSNEVYIMYSAHTIQVHNVFKKVIKTIEQGNCTKLDISIQSVADL